MPTLETADESAPDSSDNSCVAAVSIKGRLFGRTLSSLSIRQKKKTVKKKNCKKKIKRKIILMDRNAGPTIFLTLKPVF